MPFIFTSYARYAKHKAVKKEITTKHYSKSLRHTYKRRPFCINKLAFARISMVVLPEKKNQKNIGESI